jgi:hypothetical protein
VVEECLVLLVLEQAAKEKIAELTLATVALKRF